MLTTQVKVDYTEKYIPYQEAINAHQQGIGIIVDVREPAEFLEGHIPFALNLPATNFRERDYASFSNRKIFLVCQVGERARSVARQLSEAGFKEVFVLDRHMGSISSAPSEDASGWSIDRQFRLILGLFLAIFLLGYFWSSHTYFFAIPVILSLGLVITAIIDKCYLRVGIAMLPWNAKKSA